MNIIINLSYGDVFLIGMVVGLVIASIGFIMRELKDF